MCFFYYKNLQLRLVNYLLFRIEIIFLHIVVILIVAIVAVAVAK